MAMVVIYHYVTIPSRRVKLLVEEGTKVKYTILSNVLPNWSMMHTAAQNCPRAALLGCRLAYPPPADPDTLAPAVSDSAFSVSCSPSLLSVKKRESSVPVFFVVVCSFQN